MTKYNIWREEWKNYNKKELIVKSTKQAFKKAEEKEEVYLGNKIIAWREEWEEYDKNKGKWEKKAQVYCHLYRIGSKWQPLNMGECNDSSKFTAVNQAINQAKDFVNLCNKYNW